jgi:hypothetical protein
MNQAHPKMNKHLLALLEGFGWLLLCIISIAIMCLFLLFLQWLFTTSWALTLVVIILLLSYSIGRVAHSYRTPK